MREDTKIAEPPQLDRAKLLGFRNLLPVAEDSTDLRESSEILFNKKGSEAGVAA